ncbi:MAG: hypothetical protein RLZ75_3255 [Pseudomonadota bacterium]|jgi:hypothetical protein
MNVRTGRVTSSTSAQVASKGNNSPSIGSRTATEVLKDTLVR